MLDKIKKKIEKIKDKKSKLDYLTKELEAAEKEELQTKIQELIDEIVSEEDLEEKITIPEPQISVPERKFEAPKTTREQTIQTKKDEEDTQAQTIVYQGRVIDYHTQVEEMSGALRTSNPVNRDVLSNLNISRARMVDAFYDLPQQKRESHGYMGAQQQREEFLGTPEMGDISKFESPGMGIIDIIQRQKTKTIKPKYELH